MKRAASIVAAALMMVGASAGAAQAAPGDNGQGVGGCVQILYGNTTNPRPSGHGVLPSLSPGPWVNVPNGDPYMGPSMGDFMHLVTAAGYNPQDLLSPCLFT